jgi:hypothetical protein
MANITYDLQWRECMTDVLDQIDAEDPDDPDLQPQGADDLFQHYACLYIKYCQIFKKLHECYDQMVHPQKRRSVKKALEATMGRLLRIKAMLIELSEQEYVNLDDILVDLKLTPDVLELPVPKYFIEERQEELARRDELLDMIYNQHSLPKPYEDDDDAVELDMGPPMSIDDAINVVQRCELGRQGRRAYKVRRELAVQEERDRKLAEGGAILKFNLRHSVSVVPADALKCSQPLRRSRGRGSGPGGHQVPATDPRLPGAAANKKGTRSGVNIPCASMRSHPRIV